MLVQLSERQIHNPTETTTNALGAGVMLLLENPNIWAQLKSDPDKYSPTFIEEVVRLESPVQGQYRFVREDTEIAGTPLAVSYTHLTLPTILLV